MNRHMQPALFSNLPAEATRYRLRAERTTRAAVRPAPTVPVTADTRVRVRAGGFSVRVEGRAVAVAGGWS